jgi:hypothetical protein
MNVIKTRSAILRTEKYPCATIAIREDISNKYADQRLPIRKVEQRNTAKAEITVEKARTIRRIANQSVTTPAMALTTKDRTRRDEMTMSTA